MNLVVSEVDAAWITTLTLQVGANGHPSVVKDPELPGMNYQSVSLARAILMRHGIAVEDGQWVCRLDTSKPWDVSHENICIPASLIHRHLNTESKGARTICLKDYLSLFSIHRPSQPEADPVYVNVINMDTAKQSLLICDAEDASWLEGMPVRFNEKGFPMIQTDWGKWTSLMFEQARRVGAKELVEPVVFHLKPKEPRDVRKYFIAVVSKDRMASLA